MKILKFLILTIAISIIGSANAQNTFSSLDSLLNYANSKSTTLQSGEIKMTQAKRARLVAIIGVIDPTGNVSYSYTDNTKLPVNLFPAEAFGGAPGTYKEIKSGVQYNNSYNLTQEVKIFNLPGWSNLKLSKINVDLTSSDNKVTLKTMHENIASIYYNIVNLQEQLKATQQNLSAADTLLQIAQNKFQQCLVKQQDLNDSRANYLNTKESFNQLKFLLQQQYLSLKILIDIPENDSIAINQQVISTTLSIAPKIEFNDIAINNSLLKEKTAQVSYRQLMYSKLPVVSVVHSYSGQQYNNSAKIYNSDGKWFPSQYIGLKLSIPIPSANNVSQTFKAKYDYQLAQQSTEHIRNKAELEYRQLGIDFYKALSQWTTNAEVYELKKDSFEKNLNLYTEGVISLEQTLNSYNAMVNSNYNSITSAINVLLTKSKIDINNKIK